MLRFHVEAVWGVQLPPITANDIEILPGSPQPLWGVYVADIASGRIHIWQPGLDNAERAALLAHLDEALAPPTTGISTPGIRREIALHLAAQPVLTLETARQIAQPITINEYELVEAFSPNSAEYFFTDECRPLFGVIAEGHLRCIAHSSRRTSEACELGIETHLQARRRGYALAATVLWTTAVMQEGLTPLYSALAENVASLNLAASAGYRVFARGASIKRAAEG